MCVCVCVNVGKNVATDEGGFGCGGGGWAPGRDGCCGYWLGRDGCCGYWLGLYLDHWALGAWRAVITLRAVESSDNSHVVVVVRHG